MKHTKSLPWSKLAIGQRVLSPSPFRAFPRHRKLLVGAIIEKVPINGRRLRLLRVWRKRHEPKEIAGWFEATDLQPI